IGAFDKALSTLLKVTWYLRLGSKSDSTKFRQNRPAHPVWVHCGHYERVALSNNNGELRASDFLCFVRVARRGGARTNVRPERIACSATIGVAGPHRPTPQAGIRCHGKAAPRAARPPAATARGADHSGRPDRHSTARHWRAAGNGGDTDRASESR